MRTAIQTIGAVVNDETVSIHYTLIRDWNAIINDIVDAINFNSNVKIKLVSIDDSEDRNIKVTFQSKHDAKLFAEFCDQQMELDVVF